MAESAVPFLHRPHARARTNKHARAHTHTSTHTNDPHRPPDYYALLRFLRARNYEHDRAFKMWSDSMAWRREFDVDAILDNFSFHEREQFLMAYPQGYHKTDKMGRPIYIQLLGKIDIGTLKKITTEERMVKFHIQEYERCGRFIFPVCSRIAGRQIDQTFGIMDVKGVGVSHLTGEVKRLVSMLTKYDQDNYPEMLGRICIINAPMLFKAVWALIKPMLNPRTLNKIQICQTNYAADLLEWVDADNLPVWLGGRSKGTLLDDVGPWSDPTML
ncbi:MAG: CRAL-TRIO domain-containing protein, partial [Monoraphidium minutum]